MPRLSRWRDHHSEPYCLSALRPLLHASH
jgi:hypothetical protein